jgi:hypothetical protein
LLVGGYPSRTEEATVQIEDRLARFVCELQVADVPASAQRAMRQMVTAVVGTENSSPAGRRTWSKGLTDSAEGADRACARPVSLPYL